MVKGKENNFHIFAFIFHHFLIRLLRRHLTHAAAPEPDELSCSTLCPEPRKPFGAVVCSSFNEEVSNHSSYSDHAVAAELFAHKRSFLPADDSAKH